MTGEKITVRQFLARHPEAPSAHVKGWVNHSRWNGLQVAGIVVYQGAAGSTAGFRVDEDRLLAWMAEHPGQPPRPPKKDATGLSLQALAGQRPPRLLPVLLEPVPRTGRPLSVFEVHELADWGISNCHGTMMRAAPTATPGEFSLWRVYAHGVKRLPFLLTHGAPPTGSGSWVTQHEPRPTPPRKRTAQRKPTMKKTEAEHDLELAARASAALTVDLVRVCERTAVEQGLDRAELGSALLVAAIEMFSRAGGAQAAQTALRAALQKLTEDQRTAQSVN
ncbi:MAG: hypothetical protein KJ049_10920 [Gammaproteobacteria bacterium]|nr:hypothetical protein [Gammaproteobacteria bacterium]